MRQHTAEKIAIKWLVRLNSPDITEDQKEEFFAWIESSPEHQCAYIKAEQLWDQSSAITQIIEPTPLQHWMYQRQFLAIACSIIVIVMYTSLFYFNNALTSQEFHSKIGEQQEHSLKDGSQVVLNTNSALRIELLSDQRLAYVDKGEVYFNIKKDKTRPFHVITPSGNVRVVGTQFSVYNNGNDSIVTVTEGKVALNTVTLTANQRITMKQAEKGIEPITIDAKAQLAWRKNELVYRNEPLNQVLADLNRYFKEDFILEDATLNNKQVIAVIHLSTVEVTAQLLANSLNLDVELNPNESTVIFRAKQVSPTD